jgi:hypothetical protein
MKAKHNEWAARPADFKFLVNSGLLFEINRSILNPIGLALTLKKLPDGSLILSDQLKDCRSNPEQLVIDAATFENGKRKLADFLSEFGHAQMDKRRDKLGWGTQDYAEQALRKRRS